eukprot:9976971-Alexandrium_andersonii.AAC.1
MCIRDRRSLRTPGHTPFRVACVRPRVCLSACLARERRAQQCAMPWFLRKLNKLLEWLKFPRSAIL